MNREDLENIILSIQRTKTPVTITKRDLVEGLGCQKRTSNNCAYIDRFLAQNDINVEPDYKNGQIDGEISLSYRYQVKPNIFQLYSLQINTKYKNLSNFYIDFSDTNNYCCIIGLNGAGKSNVLEALSAIFYSLYHIATLKDGYKKYPCKFDYTIRYVLAGNLYEITNGLLKNGQKVTKDILPKNIIASYSGEDTRLWEKYYKPIYEKHCVKMAASSGFEPPFMLYLSKNEWEIALLTLLYSEDVDVLSFVETITQGKKCQIQIEYSRPNIRKWEGTDIEAFVEKLRETHLYDIQTFRNTINNISFIDQSSTLFYYLYKCSTDSNSQVIKKVKISIGGVLLENLSEGEKKMIMVNTIIHILASDRSLNLFDEPDSHVHVSRKYEMVHLIDTSNRYSIVTTHSPSFVHNVVKENIRHIANGKIINSKRLQQIRDLSGGEINYIEGAFILSAKNILVTEGKFDVKYLKHAIDVFAKQDAKYNRLNQVAFIQAGSAGNCKALYDDVLQESLSYIDKIVFLFDYDKGGLDGWKCIKPIADIEPKVVPIFYQQDYNVSLDTTCKDIASKDSYMVEDVFDSAAYSSVVAYYHGMNKHKDYRCNNKGRATEAIKQYIENNYATFNDAYYANFQPVLDKLLELFNL